MLSTNQEANNQNAWKWKVKLKNKSSCKWLPVCCRFGTGKPNKSENGGFDRPVNNSKWIKTKLI